MEINVSKLLALRQYVGKFDFDYEPPKDICVIPLCKVGKVRIEGEFEICEDDSVWVKFTVGYKLSGQCSYCLKAAEREISFVSEVLFVPEEDEDNYFYDGRKLDLRKAVNDAILISQPNVLLCKEGCEGIDVNK